DYPSGFGWCDFVWFRGSSVLLTSSAIHEITRTNTNERVPGKPSFDTDSAVGGWFRSNLRTALTDFLNPTNGSWWMVQIRPSKQGGTERMQKRLEFHGPSRCTGWI